MPLYKQCNTEINLYQSKLAPRVVKTLIEKDSTHNGVFFNLKLRGQCREVNIMHIVEKAKYCCKVFIHFASNAGVRFKLLDRRTLHIVVALSLTRNSIISPFLLRLNACSYQHQARDTVQVLGHAHLSLQSSALLVK